MSMSARLRVVREDDEQQAVVTVGDQLEQLAAGHRDAEDRLVELDRGEGQPDPVLRTLRDQLAAELHLWQRAILPMVAHLNDRRLGQLSQRLHADRQALTRALPTSSTDAGFRARIGRLCQRFEVHHAEEEELVGQVLRRTASGWWSRP
jgi:hypothetical protein